MNFEQSFSDFFRDLLFCPVGAGVWEVVAQFKMFILVSCASGNITKNIKKSRK